MDNKGAHHYEVHIPNWGSDSMACFTKDWDEAREAFERYAAEGRKVETLEVISYQDGVWYVRRERVIREHPEPQE